MEARGSPKGIGTFTHEAILELNDLAGRDPVRDEDDEAFNRWHQWNRGGRNLENFSVTSLLLRIYMDAKLRPWST
jgi:hypothetical protein